MVCLLQKVIGPAIYFELRGIIASKSVKFNAVSETDKQNEWKTRSESIYMSILNRNSTFWGIVDYQGHWHRFGARLVQVSMKCMWQQLQYQRQAVTIVLNISSNLDIESAVATPMKLSVNQKWRRRSRIQVRICTLQYNRRVTSNVSFKNWCAF